MMTKHGSFMVKTMIYQIGNHDWWGWFILVRLIMIFAWFTMLNHFNHQVLRGMVDNDITVIDGYLSLLIFGNSWLLSAMSATPIAHFLEDWAALLCNSIWASKCRSFSCTGTSHGSTTHRWSSSSRAALALGDYSNLWGRTKTLWLPLSAMDQYQPTRVWTRLWTAVKGGLTHSHITISFRIYDFSQLCYAINPSATGGNFAACTLVDEPFGW